MVFINIGRNFVDMTKRKNILILNGPNLNLLGIRQPEIYGSRTLEDLEEMCISKGKACSMNVIFEQTNSESKLVTFIQEAINTSDGIIINAAAYSHTSVAILDALNAFQGYVIEVHISDISKREAFRQFSYVSLRANHVIMGRGLEGYIEAIEKIQQEDKI
ncbi:MAG: type II 3-dehydroquinate dehydratase [Paracoccaceae bacterium]